MIVRASVERRSAASCRYSSRLARIVDWFLAGDKAALHYRDAGRLPVTDLKK
jgi:hypothetical protein